MNLKSFPSLDRGASSTRAHPHVMGQHKLINRSIVASLLSLVAMATVSQPEKAGAVDLSFGTPDTGTGRPDVSSNPNTFGFGFGPGVSANVIHYKNVAAGLDAVVTATVFDGTGTYAFDQHIYNYSVNQTGQPTGDAAFLYYNAPAATGTTGLGTGGMTYKIDLFTTNGTTHTYSTAAAVQDLRLLVYDVDGENSLTNGLVPSNQGTANQKEAVRISQDSGLVGYQVGNQSNSLVASRSLTDGSYLFTGPGANYAESNTTGAAIFYFQGVNSVTLQFEADTLSPNNGNNPVFSAIDGDVSLIGQNSTNFDSNGHATPAAGFGTYQVATKIPEPFSIIGSLIGGGVAFGMRKKLKATSK
jgi:hypothetical protein